MQLLAATRQLLLGQSYWKAILSSGRVVSELDTVFDLRTATRRKTEWLEDVIGSGDLKHVQELILCTPQGDVHLPISRPYTAFQFNRGAVSLLDGQRTKHAQIIGRIENEAGQCIAAIWDIVERKLYPDFITNIYAFGAWREGITPIGALNLDALGIRL